MLKNKHANSSILMMLVTVLVGGIVVGETTPSIHGHERATMPLSEICGVPQKPTNSRDAEIQPPADMLRTWERIQYAISHDQYAEALRMLDETTQDDHLGWRPLLVEKAELLIRAGRVDQANAITLQLKARGDQSPRLQYLLGEIAGRLGDEELAISYFRTATLTDGQSASDPYVTGAWYRLAATLSQKGYTRAAAEAYLEFDRRIWGTYPEHRFATPVRELMPEVTSGTLRLQRELWLKIGMPDKALAAAAEARSIRPDDLNITRQYVEGLLDANENQKAFDVALDSIRAKLATGDATVDALRPLITAASNATTGPDHVRALLELVDRSTTSAEKKLLCTHLAESLSLFDKQALASAFWSRIRESGADAVDAVAKQVLTLLALGDREAAEKSLESFMRPGYQSGLMTYFVDADDCVHGSQHRGPDEDADVTLTPSARIARALIALHSGRAMQARDLARPLFEGETEWRQVASLISGAALIAEYDWRGAQEVVDQIIEKSPQSGEALFLSALIQRGLDDESKATAAYQAAANALPENAAVAFSFGRYLLARGSRDVLKAQRFLQRAFAADPYHVEAAELLLESYLSGDSPKVELARGVVERVERGAWPADALRRMNARLRYASRLWSQEHINALASEFQDFPNDMQTGLRLLEGRLRRSQYAEALMLATALRQRCPESERVLRLYAQAQRFNLNFAGAADALRTLTARYPNSIYDRIELTEYLSWDGQADAAIAAMESLLATKEDSREGATLLLNLLSTCASHRQYQKALKLRAEYGPKFKEFDWNQQQITILVMAGRADDAIEQLKRELAANPGDEQTRTLIFAVCLQAQRPAEARKYLETWLRDVTGADGLEYRFRLLQAMLEMKDFDAAVEAARDLRQRLEKMGLRQSFLPLIKVREGRAFLGLNNHAVAEQLFREALRDPGAVEDLNMRESLRNDVITYLVEARAYDSALAFLDSWEGERNSGVRSDDTMLLAWRQNILHAAGRTDEYLAIAAQRYEQDPTNPFINNDFGYSLADEGIRLHESLKMIRLAVANEPGNAAYLDSLGWVYYKLNQMPEAVKYLARAVSLHAGQDPVLYDHYADALYRSGSAAAAVAAWRSAIKLFDEPAGAIVVNDDPELRTRVEAKIAAVEAGDEPDVAPIPIDS